MKRLPLNPSIEHHLRRSLGADADLAAVAVFEATAINTLPIRKTHPIYKDARMEVGVLHEMASEIIKESLPVQIQHDTEPLPVGRVFHGEVHPIGSDFELRVLFFIDATEQTVVDKIETGSVDQVSVSVLTKQALNSVSGFDYFGEDAAFDNIWSGDDGEGNVLGQNGVYARLVGLDQFYEMSLVGKGGARNARIHRRDQSYFGSSFEKLAASGIDPNVFILAASIEEPKMDLTELVEKLTTKEVEVARLTDQLTTLQAEKDALTTKVVELEARPEPENVDQVKADLSAAQAALKDVAKTILTASGQQDAEVPEDTSAVIALVEGKKADLTAALVLGGKAKGADAQNPNTDATGRIGSFRINRR